MIRRTESCRHVYRKERSATGQPDRIWETLLFEFLQKRREREEKEQRDEKKKNRTEEKRKTERESTRKKPKERHRKRHEKTDRNDDIICIS